MEGTTLKTYEFDIEDVEYLRHGDTPLLARITRPRGDGPFPCVVELHGGAWTQYDRTRGKALHAALAKSGITVVALDFRQGEDRYPSSLADINYAIRWAKAHAKELKTRPDLVGLSGNSSGGHLAVLAAMRPDDPRYAAIPLPAGTPAQDASLRCVVAFWPVINPLSRYRKLVRQAKEKGTPPSHTQHQHDIYWGDEESQAEGNPLLILERGEKVTLPPLLIIQANDDDSHNYKDEESDFPGTEPARFVSLYRAAGGQIEDEWFDAPRLFVTEHPAIPQSLQALDDVVAFFHKHIPVG